MEARSTIRTRLQGWFFNVADLLLWWVLLVLAQALVPRASWLADLSLLPWLALTLSGCLWLRHRSLLPGPHLALTPRRSLFSRLCQRLGLVALPWAVLLWFELAYDLRNPSGGHGVLVAMAPLGSVLVTVLLSLGQQEGLTAWNPHQRGYVPLLVGAIAAVAFALIGVEWWRAALGGWAWGPRGVTVDRLLLPPVYVGGTLLLAGVVASPPRDVRQFLAGQLHQGVSSLKAVAYLVAPQAAALVLPMVGLLVFHGLYLDRYAGLGFNGAIIHTLFVCLSCAALFPRPVPVAMACLFHELYPTGGKEREGQGGASDFTESPEGALVFNPLNTRRTRRIHPSLIPVESTRLPLLDTRAPHLWPLEGLAPQAFLFGPAAFEPVGSRPQWREVTIRKGSRDLVSWKSETESSLQRILILRAFSERWFKARRGVFDHEQALYEGQLQSMGDLSDTLALRDGDVVLLSVGGMIRAFQFEIGRPLYESDLVVHARVPTLEDYVELK